MVHLKQVDRSGHCLFGFRPLVIALGLVAGLILGMGAATPVAVAQDREATAMTRTVPAQIDADAIALSGAQEDAVSTEIWSDFGEERWVRNVNRPTLLPVRPEPDVDNGISLLLIPGGGFQFVSIDNEGYRIADDLVARGYTVFILKYRTMTTPVDDVAFSEHMRALFSGQLPFESFDRSIGEALAVADAVEAWHMMHDRADAWGLDPERTGVLGFSAGAMTALGMARSTDDQVPAFLGYIYGPMTRTALPQSLPPLFTALAADDTLFAGQGFGMVEDWQARGGEVELHYYASGGHGFGSYRRGTAADNWLDQFDTWLSTR